MRQVNGMRGWCKVGKRGARQVQGRHKGWKKGCEASTRGTRQSQGKCN